MTFVSYAQNFEDVVLWRALQDVEGGRYLDIGAQEPELDSVSLAFYRLGWRGIHVEPTPTYATLLRSARPDETVIEAAVTDAPGPITLYELGGLSSGCKDVAEHHRRNGYEPRSILVPTVRLDHLLDLSDGDVHWMKIDVEGMEADVLRSWGDSPKRPWVLVIESTFPMSRETTEQQWIDQVQERGYEEAFFDGLSRYFVHESHRELAERLGQPANVFDDFQISSRHFAARLTQDEAEEQKKLSEARVAALSLDILQLRESLRAHQSELEGERSRNAQELKAAKDDAAEVQLRLREAETELAVERAKVGQLEDRERQSAAEVQKLREGHRSEREARAEINAELDKISTLVGAQDSGVQFSRTDQWLQPGIAYAAVTVRLESLRQELQTAREFAVDQFVAGQESRSTEIGFLSDRLSTLQIDVAEERHRVRSLSSELGSERAQLGGRIASLEDEIAAARSRLAQEEDQSGKERARLQEIIDEYASSLAAVREEACRLDLQLAEARASLTTIFGSKRGRLARWLGLLPAQLVSESGALPKRLEVSLAAQPLPSEQSSSETAQERGMDLPVNEQRHVSTLLALNGSAFVDALYRVFLKRSPDRAGRDHYVARLQTGVSKEDVLVALATSPEARAAGTSIDGFSELRRAHDRERRWSFIGGAKPIKRRLNRLEYSIGEAHNSLADRLDRMESSLEQIQAKLENSLRMVPAREAGVYVQGVPVSIKRGMPMRPSNGAAEFIEQLRDSVQSSMEAQTLRNGR